MIIQTILAILLCIVDCCICVTTNKLSMRQYAPPTGAKNRDQWTKDPTWYAESAGAYVGAEGATLNFQGLLDVANSYYNWLLTQDKSITPKGWCLVAAMWDPSTKRVYASSIPRGPRKVFMIKEREAAPLWLAQVAPLLQPYLDAKDDPLRVADIKNVKIHAEDGVYFNWESTKGSLAVNGRYPDGTMIAVWGKGPGVGDVGRQYPLCSTVSNRDPTCQAVAIALGVQYQAPQVAPAPANSDDAFDDSTTQDDVDAYNEACAAGSSSKKRHLIRGQGPARRDATTTACPAFPLPSDGPVDSVSLDLPSSDFGSSNPSSSSSSNPAPTKFCTYEDATPEGPASCVCSSGHSTISVEPTSIAKPTVITQSCDFSTWPGSQPAVTAPPKTVTTNFAGTYFFI